ncbi:MAG: GNAT family N-acetyltransferase, partial [Desulfovibrionales bacterium]
MTKSRESRLAALRENPHAIAAGQKFEVDEFRPEDAPGIARLYYIVYGETFPVDHVYDPDELIRLQKSGVHHLVVGRTERGDIVGLYALFRNPPGRHIMEEGSWMVHPEYRGGSLSMRLA